MKIQLPNFLQRLGCAITGDYSPSYYDAVFWKLVYWRNTMYRILDLSPGYFVLAEVDVHGFTNNKQPIKVDMLEFAK